MTTILEHWGGLEKYYIDVANKLNESDDLEVDIITLSDSFSLNFIKLLSIYNLKKIDQKVLFKESSAEIKRKLIKTNYIKCKNFYELRKTLNNYDVIYSKNELLEAFIFKFFIGYRNVPQIIFGCHTSLNYPSSNSFRQNFRNFLYSGLIYKFLTSEVKAFHTINSYDFKIAKKLFPNKIIFKIFNPFNFVKFKSKVNESMYKFSKDKTKILWIGTLTYLKGTEELIKIIKNLKSECNYKDKIEWIIAGNGPDLNLIQNLIEQYPDIKYLGFIDYEKVPSLINSVDIMISTSKVETFSFTTIEANSLNKPVFSFKTSGQKDIIEDNINGKITNSTDELTYEIKRYVDKCYNFNNISTFISKKFDEKVIYSDLKKMFKSIAEKNSYGKN